MNRLNSWTVARCAALSLVGLIPPIAGAATVATTQQELVALHGNVPILVVPVQPGADGERLQQMALLALADGKDISRSLQTRFPSTSVSPSRADQTQMGLELPEPGPLSAIIATLALAGFVMIRRVV